VVFKSRYQLFLASIILVLASTAFSQPVAGDQFEARQPLNLTSAFAVETKREARNILESLDLSLAQKSEIQSILLAAMQSMEAVNGQLYELESDKERMLSMDVQEMVKALHQQRVQLAEMLSIEILSLLSSQQRSRLKLKPDSAVEPVRESLPKMSVKEYEI